ncbi:polyprenyl synthetase family protein [Chromobacterium subtsugae]|uniref:Polyprenyl synthetase family protein n=1 Tax=Chromobacterium subtsugae TaxID=251747 RepID=A0ABS7FIE1_9NEIS|nr:MULTISPECIES: farnesyl diphosphate synthase [Chromobacterium]KUM03295.1 geranyl transferase [Chromobacterium subtsugae]KZE85049.1 geranyl transferase [Chromobacterium sp. F49]MBW7568501.1 polyprenyl synthetase family protein [Chromobacterium subtsugae]MBW8289853.1 polyprenyl synthetase family protein [Chromobacterium subtsugae]WSE89581.1 farnesyl diphosphate synthase [Chromobacterium subtsugae]
MANETFIGWMTAIQQHMEAALERLLPAADAAPQRLHQAMRYATLEGGKRVRPLLAFAAGELVDAKPENLARVGAALEMIHAYSLVHDDMPCMDDDVLRRGKPTCHVAYDEATALLVGDALQTRAFELIATPLPGIAPASQLEIVRILAHASGHAGMAGGQAIDLASVGQPLTPPELEFMHMLKTGALIRASVLMGAMAGSELSAADKEALDVFAKRVGLAFQVVDDILDCEADTATLGKTAGKDAAHDKPTYVSLLGLAEAKRMAKDLHDQAFAALQGFGPRADRLRQLADYIVARSF